MMESSGSEDHKHRLLAIPTKDRLVRVLRRVLNEKEFLSPGGIRALSKYHEKNPYSVTIDNINYTIQYDPGDSTSNLFGGNSNWRGPVWMPINYLIIQSIRKYGLFYGNALKVECPVGSGNYLNLEEVADFLTQRVISLFQPDASGAIPQYGKYNRFYQQPGNEHLNLFYEYFHGDNGQGLGACQQTGWTALLAELINEQQLRAKRTIPTETPEITVVT